jgi:hypothetical protein
LRKPMKRRICERASIVAPLTKLPRSPKLLDEIVTLFDMPGGIPIKEPSE